MNDGIEAGVENTQILTAENGEYWAKLGIEYTWSDDGETLCAEAKRYQVRDNGQNQGTITLCVEANESREQILISDAMQDGKWHSISGGTCAKSSGSGDIIFTYQYARANAADVTLVTTLPVTFP